MKQCGNSVGGQNAQFEVEPEWLTALFSKWICEWNNEEYFWVGQGPRFAWTFWDGIALEEEVARLYL